MSRITSHVAIATAALIAGGLGATAFSSTEPERQATTVPRPLPPQVRTVVVTKTIHRVRHVRVHARRPAPVAAPPAPVAVLPQRVPVRSTVVTRRPVPTTHPLKTRTSGHGGGGGEGEGGEHEGGGDD